MRPRAALPSNASCRLVASADARDFDRRLQELEDASEAPRPALQSRGRLGTTSDRRVFAADLLQMQQSEITDSILDCESRRLPGKQW